MSYRWLAGLGAVLVCACGNDMTVTGGNTGGSSSSTGGGAATGTGGGTGTGAGPSSSTGGGASSSAGGGSAIDPNSFWANDPPPMWCGPDGGTTPPLVPGGTPDCPDDKNRQGCPCTTPGMQAPCWPGLRANRNLGVCRDGVTTCTSTGEFGSVWGECTGYVPPVQGATSGAAACKCFSAGQWAIANLSPCFIQDGSGNVVAAVSTFQDPATGNAKCPGVVTNPPAPEPGQPFSKDTLKVDCAGHFKLCYELKAGKAAMPSAADCSLTKVCVDVDYTTPNAVQTLPPLPSWVGTSGTCAAAFSQSGYGEMSVIGQSVRCDAIDDGSGHPKVFNRVQYCPSSCNTNPTGPGCAGCGQGGGGTF